MWYKQFLERGILASRREGMGAGERITFAKNPEKIIGKALTQFVQESLGNRRRLDGGKYWDAPLVGFASGDDPLFRQYKKIIGKFHFTPQEIFDLTFGKGKTSRELSVISWVLPASEDIRKSNRKETKYPSLLWAHARDFGEQFNIKLRNHLISLLKKKGYRAVAPMNSSHFRRLKSRQVGWASNWSERHAAYACGLGAFGLSDGLITAKGKAMRVGSVVTDLPLKPSEKIFPHPRPTAFTTSTRHARFVHPVARLERLRKRAMIKIDARDISTESSLEIRKRNTGSRLQGAVSARPKFLVNLRFRN